jgi:uncharacterized repeat protein (TIGR01451 family)
VVRSDSKVVSARASDRAPLPAAAASGGVRGLAGLGLAMGTAVATLALLAPVSSAAAAADLRIAQTHRPSHFTPGMIAARLSIEVSNVGDEPTGGAVTVSDSLPTGLTATAAAGEGWACSGTSTRTCTRSDPLAAGASYPPITLVVNVAGTAAAEVANTATVTGGGDADPSNNSATDAIPARDACPNGWSPEQTVSFAPPFRPGRPGGIDSEVVNAERSDGCTLLDRIWDGEPFASHGRFVNRVDVITSEFVAKGLLTAGQKDAIQSAAARSTVGTKSDHQVDNSCSSRIAFTFDDGTSSYRPLLLQVLREKQVHANFFDNGFRVAANPQWARFQIREGHLELNHTYNHLHMDQVSAATNRAEVLDNEHFLASIGAPLTFKGIRPPFGGSNPGVQRTLLEMGYTYFLNRIDASDWLPELSAAQIRDGIVNQLRPGVIIALHDGPADTPAGAATVDAAGQIIDVARSLGYCFGVLDPSGQVVADRYVSSNEPIPGLVNPVPYHRLEFGTEDMLPDPWVFELGPLTLSATHSPSTFRQGDIGNSLTLTVTNEGDTPTDGETVTVRDPIPSGLTATAASGPGWTCTGIGTRTCARTDILSPHSSYPPITITVDVSSTAPSTITNQPTVTGHGGVWTGDASDAFSVEQP